MESLRLRLSGADARCSPDARAPRGREPWLHHRGRPRALVHAVRRLPAARDARAGGRRGARRARAAVGSPDRGGASARRARGRGARTTPCGRGGHPGDRRAQAAERPASRRSRPRTRRSCPARSRRSDAGIARSSSVSRRRTREPPSPVVKAGELDLALLFEYDFVPLAADDAVELVHLLDDPINAVLPRTHPAARRPSVRSPTSPASRGSRRPRGRRATRSCAAPAPPQASSRR